MFLWLSIYDLTSRVVFPFPLRSNLFNRMEIFYIHRGFERLKHREDLKIVFRLRCETLLINNLPNLFDFETRFFLYQFQGVLLLLGPILLLLDTAISGKPNVFRTRVGLVCLVSINSVYEHFSRWFSSRNAA